MDTPDILLADCPARTTLEIISGSWSVVVIYPLRAGPRRHGQLAREIGGISNKVLTQTLRRLERHGIISRDHVAAGSVRYAMTPLGASLLEPVAILAEWAHAHAEAVADAQGAVR